MAQGMFGANIEELIGLAGVMHARRDTAQTAARVASGAIEGVDWMGEDAEAFRSSYGESITAVLGDLAEMLVVRKDELERQAEDQEACSAAHGGEGCLGGGANLSLPSLGDILSPIGSFLKGVFIDGLWGDVKDTLGLIGMNFDDGFSWNLDNAKTAWGDTLKGLGALIGRDPETGEWSWGTAGGAWKSLGKNLLAWDMWREDPARAFGTVLWNIGSMAIPGVGAVKVAKWLRKADVDLPPTNRADVDTPRRHPDGGEPRNLPDSVTRNPDGSISTPLGDIPVERQHTNIPVRPDGLTPEMNAPHLRPDATIDGRPVDPARVGDNRYEPNSLYHHSNGEIHVTNDRGHVDYSALSATRAEIEAFRAGRPNPERQLLDEHGPASQWTGGQAGDQRGHGVGVANGGSDNMANLGAQSAGANAGVGRGANSGAPTPSQGAVETRMSELRADSRADERMTWERRVNGREYGNPDSPTWSRPDSYDVRGTRENGDPVDPSYRRGDPTRPRDRPDLIPDDDGWIRVSQ